QAPTTPARLAATDATVAPRSSTVRARPEPVAAFRGIRMPMRRMLLLVLLACLALGGVRAQAAPLQADCSFTQGFATLHSLIPDVVGDCVANALPQPSGDVQQQTANGMLVWRKGANGPAFPNGATPGINGPGGRQGGSNARVFPGEQGAGCDGSAVSPPPAPTATPSAAAAGGGQAGRMGGWLR